MMDDLEPATLVDEVHAPVVFFGYPRSPVAQREAVVEAAKRLHNAGALIRLLWEDLGVSGRLLIDVILGAINDADLAAFDVTTLNHNVMFELGYAIGIDRKIWLFRDETDIEATRKWDRVKILTTVGYSPFTSSEQLVQAFWKEHPLNEEPTIFRAAIKDYLSSGLAGGLFYLPSLHETEAGRKLTRRVRREESAGIRCIVADPDESAFRSLSWYAQSVYASSAVIAHFCSPNRYGGDVHNARCALIAGLAHGMKKPLLMLAEGEYTAPVDYRDLLYKYANALDCLRIMDDWLTDKLAVVHERQRMSPMSTGADLEVELRSLRLGDPVAENEVEGLSEYFVETASYREVLERRATVFVGRKGTGKTANMLRAAAKLRADKRNLVCVIKPVSYELSGILELMRRSRGPEEGYVVESLWKFLIYSEMACAIYREIIERPVLPPPETDEYAFLAFMDGEGSSLREEFTNRLEAAVQALIEVDGTRSSISEQRATISEALHRGILQDLRGHLGKVLSQKRRVAVLVDNLDKTWQKGADIENMAIFLLGLLSSVGRISDDFAASDSWRRPVAATVAVFVRDDIYDHVAKVAREPDKIPTSRLYWDDSELLLRVIEERYSVYQGEGADPKEIWSLFFCPTTRGIGTRQYILNRVLPKPRDIIYFCNEAIASAVNRKRGRIEEDDVMRAEQFYSQFAFESLNVENGVSLEDLERVLFEFAGVSAEMREDEVAAHIMDGGMGADQVPVVMKRLRALSFLGIEVGENRFDFGIGPRDPNVADALASRYVSDSGTAPRFQVHPAFRSYLEIRD